MKKGNAMAALIDGKINRFIGSFSDEVPELFTNDNNELIHSGEYGTYRERVCIELLRAFIPMDLSIGTGFIIDGNNNISHQCDIVVYDTKRTVNLENEHNQRFFPIESVVAVGEVKSNLSKPELMKALLRLSDVKQMWLETSQNATIIDEVRGRVMREVMPEKIIEDQIVTFLICNSIDLVDNSIKALTAEIRKNYDNIPEWNRHNLILSIKNGCFDYFVELDDKNSFLPYPFIFSGGAYLDVYNSLEVAKDEKTHIKTFLSWIYFTTSRATRLEFDLNRYLDKNSSRCIEVFESKD